MYFLFKNNCIKILRKLLLFYVTTAPPPTKHTTLYSFLINCLSLVVSYYFNLLFNNGSCWEEPITYYWRGESMYVGVFRLMWVSADNMV